MPRTRRTTPAPTLIVETDLLDRDEYEVRVYDDEHERTLVAAIEIVSPANKDWPEHRRAFVAKCLALLQNDVCVSIVDLVTIRQFNMYADLLGQIDRTDPALGKEPRTSTRSRFAGGSRRTSYLCWKRGSTRSRSKSPSRRY